MGWVGGILLGVASSGLTWLIFAVLGHPRLLWSRHVAEQSVPGACSVYRAKIMNMLPWSAAGVEIEAFLILNSPVTRRVIVRVPVSESRFPLLGGASLPTRRRHRYGWMGASHRVITILPGSFAPHDARRMRPEDVALLRGGTAGRLAEVLGRDGELLVSAQAVDGAFLGDERRCVRVYRARDVVAGSFARGRSLAISTPATDAGSDV